MRIMTRIGGVIAIGFGLFFLTVVLRMIPVQAG
jgi:hypothetical protein